MAFNLQRWQQTQDELAHYRRRKQFVAETLGHGEHLLQITVGDPTKVTVFDMGYDDDGQHECEITIHEKGIELDDVIAFVERDRRIVGKYDLPGPTPEEYRAMKASIERRGIWVPVIVDEAGNVIEGQVRRRIAQELGINCPSIVYRGQTAQEKLELAHELDSCRKHYSQKQKAKVVERLLRRMRGSSPHPSTALVIPHFQTASLCAPEDGAAHISPTRSRLRCKTERLSSWTTADRQGS